MTDTSEFHSPGDDADCSGTPSAPPRLCVGLIGFGAVGREVASRLNADERPFEIICLTRRPAPDASVTRWVHKTCDLIAEKPNLVIEAAGHSAVAEHVVPLLRARIPVIIVSVGALADDELRSAVTAAAQEGSARVIFPAGAIGALDYIRAVAQLPNLRIRYCSRKPVAAWEKELLARGMLPREISCEVTLFEGSAQKAALVFPQNLNVAMSLALAGPGIESVEVRVVADPKATGNTHEIDIESMVGRATLTFSNTPSAENPKTSALTALSVVHEVREHIGALGDLH